MTHRLCSRRLIEKSVNICCSRWPRWGCFPARGVTQVSLPLLVFSIHAEPSGVLWQAHKRFCSYLALSPNPHLGRGRFVQINFSWPYPSGLTSFSRLRFRHMRLSGRRSLPSFTRTLAGSPKVSDRSPEHHRKAGTLRDSTAHAVGASNTGLRYAAARSSLGPTRWDGGRRTTTTAI